MTVTATQEEIKAGTERAFGTNKNPVQQTTATAPVVPAAKPATEVAPVAPEAIVPDPNAVPEKKNYDDITDEELDAILAKRTKGAVKSIGDIIEPKRKTKEEIEKEEEEERAEALAFAISTGRVKKDDYDHAVAVKSKSKRDIALDIFTQEVKLIDDKLEPEEVAAMFADFYGETEAEGTWRRKKGAADMEKAANGYLSQFSEIDNITDSYRNHKTSEYNRSQISKQVDKVFDTVADKLNFKFSYQSAAGEDSEVELPYAIEESDLKAIKKEAKKNIVGLYTQMGVKPEDIKESDLIETINAEIKSKLFDKVMSTTLPAVAQRAKEETELFYKNIPVRTPNFASGQGTKGGTQKVQFTEEERKRFPGRRS